MKSSKRPLGIASAILSVYWFDGSVDSLIDIYSTKEAHKLPKEVARTWMACVAALCPDRLGEVQSSLLGHPSDDVARLGRFLTELLAGRVDHLGNCKTQKPRSPLPGKYYDARSWLILDIAASLDNDKLRGSNTRDFNSFYKLVRTTPEATVSNRISLKLFEGDPRVETGKPTRKENTSRKSKRRK